MVCHSNIFLRIDWIWKYEGQLISLVKFGLLTWLLDAKSLQGRSNYRTINICLCVYIYISLWWSLSTFVFMYRWYFSIECIIYQIQFKSVISQTNTKNKRCNWNNEKTVIYLSKGIAMMKRRNYSGCQLFNHWKDFLTICTCICVVEMASELQVDNFIIYNG